MTKTLLRIDAGIRQAGSYSRQLGDYFEKRWLEQNEGATLVGRDLQQEPLPHLQETLARAYFSGNRNQDILLQSNRLCDELKACTDLLITCPMYNFGIPATLKTWLDYVVRTQETFKPLPGGGYSGMLQDRKAWLILARGGSKAFDTFDAFEAYLTGMLAFMGITDVQCILMENTQQEHFSGTWPATYQRQVDAMLVQPAFQE